MNINCIRIIALATVIGATGAVAQEAATPHPHGEMMSGKMAGMGDHGMPMMAMHEQMMAEMKAMEARLDLKVAAMNSAKGGAKTNAIAAVVNEMVAQQKEMMIRMNAMHEQMMAQMKGMDMGKGSAGK